MNPQRHDLVALVLLIARRLALATAFWLFSAVSVAASLSDVRQLVQQLDEALVTCQQLEGQVTDYDVVFRRDPMRTLVDAQGRLVTSSGLHGGMSVDGVIWSPERPLAVIDDELFATGDVIGPYTIRQIRQDGVVIQRDDSFQLIPLDRGLETQHERRVDPLSLLSLPEDVPAPFAPRRSAATFSSE